uniref:Uncharacterized protein n=1 Tax=Geospiza parvula TaxID=87175 RepID=A0A8C3NI99_GEOPR
ILLIHPLAPGLAATLTAGHLLIQPISTASTALFSTIPAVSLLTLPVLFLLTILEEAVAIIQAYVFVLKLQTSNSHNGTPSTLLPQSSP